MASLIDAGLPVTKALRQPHPNAIKKVVRQLAEEIDAGHGQLSELMQNHPGLFSDFECKIIKVGEETGRLEKSFQVLAEYFEERRDLTSTLLSEIAYPLLVFHCAAVLIPFISFITGECSMIGMFVRMALAIGIPYLLVISFFVYKWLEQRRKVQLPLFFSKFCLGTPLFGTLLRKLNYARFFHAYSISVTSGLFTVDGVILAAGSCGNSWIKNSFMQTAEIIKNNGCPFSEALKATIYPADRESIAIELMATGEMSGKSDESAAKIADIYRSDSKAGMKMVVSIVPKVVYLCMAIYIGWVIINFWSNLFAKTTSL